MNNEEEEKTENPYEGMPDISAAAQAAAAMREMFDTYIEAGFTERQALVLIAEMIRPRGHE